MRTLRRVVVGLLFVALFWAAWQFTHRNDAPIAVDLLAVRVPAVPTWAALMAAFGAGGLLAGLAAAMTVLGQRLSLTTSVAGSLGFDAITVALLGRATPLGTLLAGLLFGALDAGGVQMQAGEGTPIQLTEVIKALIVLFVAAPAVVRSMLRFKARRDHGETTMAAKGWGG